MKSKSNKNQRMKNGIVLATVSLIIAGAIASSIGRVSAQATFGNSLAHPSGDLLKQQGSELGPEWNLATDAEEEAQWNYILNSPLGIAALNQLAIEGFISPLCPKTFYINEQTGGFQSLMKVECPDPRGASIAVAYDEVHVILNRFESNIESFDIQRFGQN